MHISFGEQKCRSENFHSSFLRRFSAGFPGATPLGANLGRDRCPPTWINCIILYLKTVWSITVFSLPPIIMVQFFKWMPPIGFLSFHERGSFPPRLHGRKGERVTHNNCSRGFRYAIPSNHGAARESDVQKSARKNTFICIFHIASMSIQDPHRHLTG